MYNIEERYIEAHNKHAREESKKNEELRQNKRLYIFNNLKNKFPELEFGDRYFTMSSHNFLYCVDETGLEYGLYATRANFDPKKIFTIEDLGYYFIHCKWWDDYNKHKEECIRLEKERTIWNRIKKLFR